MCCLVAAPVVSIATSGGEDWLCFAFPLVSLVPLEEGRFVVVLRSR